MERRDRLRHLLESLPKSALIAVRDKRIEGSFKFNDYVTVCFDGRVTKTITVTIQPPSGDYLQFRFELDEIIDKDRQDDIRHGSVR